MTTTTRSRLLNIVGGSAGNFVEYFDWYVYTAFALYFAPSFFPKGDQTAQLLSTAAVFAVGFFMRPIGAAIMGRYADTHGRKAGLALSVGLMCVGALMIAAAPTYAQAGLLSPAVLVLARMLQGLSLGGEYGASATYLSEMAGPRNRGFWSSFQYVTLIGGQLAALALLLVLQAWLGDDALTAWGWRIAFAAGAALAIVVYFIRRRLAETPSYARARLEAVDRPKSGMVTLMRDHPREALLAFSLTAGGTLAFYADTTYMQKFLVNTVGFDKATGSRIMTFALIAMIVMQPIAGLISDRIGRKPMMTFFGVAGTLLTVPFFMALENATNPLTAFALVMANLVILTAYTSINAVVKAELFPDHIRALGVALPYALSNTIFGGTAEYVALWLKGAGHEQWFYWYVAGIVALSLVSYASMRETRDAGLIAD
ncbi:MFS transporter [Novosphingobium tardum]|uniref:MFS transporter n=1 Tax=Novosphingobium tardum TaxID=1538021 RepID=A0ABV8RNW6_9SPHN